MFDRTVLERPSWNHYYERDLTWSVHLSNILHHLPYLRLIRSLRPRSVLEIGAGSGSTSTALSYFVPRVVSIDYDKEIVNRCARVSRQFFGRAEYRHADAFDLSEFGEMAFDVAVSQGFFEHFANAKIGDLMNEQLRVARHVCFSVPNALYGRQDFGDERLLTREQWDGLITDLGLRVETSRDYAPLHRTTTPWRFWRLWRLPRSMYAAVVSTSPAALQA